MFVAFPYTNDYYVAQFAYYNDEIPSFFKIENRHGFHAELDEYYYVQNDSSDIEHPIYVPYTAHCNSGFFFSTVNYAHSNLSPHNLDTIYRCLGDTLLLTVEHNPDSLTFDWIVDGVPHYNTRTLNVPLTSLDTLTAQLVINYPCPDTTTTFVIVVPPPVIPFGMDTTVCAGAVISVQNDNVLSYAWSTGDTTPSISIDSAGTYSVSVTNRGCTANLDSFRVSLYEPSSVNFGPDTFLCALATLLLDAQQTHPATYEWQDHSTNSLYTVIEDGDYWVIVTDQCLGATDSINVKYLNDFVLDLGPDTLLCEGDELLLAPGIPYCSYEWQDGSTAETYIVQHFGDYSVTATNHCFTHSDEIAIDYHPCEQELYLPNSFTPNGDGLNDRFQPIFSYPDDIEWFELRIYDRWGGLLFVTKDFNYGWDGNNVIPGIYNYLIYYKTVGHAERLVQGSVTLVR